MNYEKDNQQLMIHAETIAEMIVSFILGLKNLSRLL
jgi:hypothetical protein